MNLVRRLGCCKSEASRRNPSVDPHRRGKLWQKKVPVHPTSPNLLGCSQSPSNVAHPGRKHSTDRSSPTTAIPPVNQAPECRQLSFSTPRPSLACVPPPGPPLPSNDELTRLQRRGEALKVNISAGEGLQDVLKSNLGPRGTIKM